ncbi:hypothetical protein BKH31_09800 [Actinomyces oris]|uniref:Uncharacterized protein n=1 Tax=Actinomyces oris TaxID=544580 RepID=A0A1Q8VA00_9ACTO|nr:hypothetical protein BKH31_09800 [Actinomyces oris]
MSMVLTSKAHRRRTPKISRRIPTIPTGCFDGWIVNVSAVDTRPRGSESGVLGGGPAPPSQVRPRPAYCTRVGIHWPMVVRTARRPHLPAVPPDPPPAAPHPRAVRPDDAGSQRSDRGSSPLRQAEAQLFHLADAPKRCSAMS